MSSDVALPVALFPHRQVPSLGGVRFIDIDLVSAADVDLIWESLYEVPDRFAGCEALIFRWPTAAEEGDLPRIHEFLDSAVRRRSALGHPAGIEVLAPRIGAKPFQIVHGEGPPADLLALRDLEVGSLLDERGSHLGGDGYHFLLPSGAHADVFIRVANALRTPRDVWVFSSWMLGDLRPRCGILLDTPTLTPIAVQLSAFASAAGMSLGEVALLDRYPNSRVDVDRTVERASRLASCVAVLSVDSTGSTRRMLEEALEARLADAWSLNVIVASTTTSPTGSPRVSTWCTTALTNPHSTEECESCRKPEVAHLVAIDAATYYPLPSSVPEVMVPSIAVAENARFWELVDEANALTLEVLPSPEAQDRRGERTPLGVRLLHDRLLSQPAALVDAVQTRVAAIRNGEDTETNRHLNRVLDAAASSNVLFVEGPDYAGIIVDSLASVLSCSPGFRIAVDKDSLCDIAAEGDRVLVLRFGSLTGEGMKKQRVAVTDAYGGRGVVINGLCLHARPSTRREWLSAINSFRPGVMGALWLSYLPWESPLGMEREMLSRLGSYTDISRARLDLLSSVSLQDRDRVQLTALWGASESFAGQDRLRPTSVYGDKLRTNAAYAAVGSGVHLARVKYVNQVRRRVFDLAAIGAPYFDATLIASILRWIRSSEAWWGIDPAAQRGTLDKLWEAGTQTDSERAVLVPEFFIAAALGKLTPAAFVRLEERLQALIQTNFWRDDSPIGEARRALILEARRIARLTLNYDE